MKIDLAELKKEYDRYDSLREKIIIQSRSVMKSAKRAIYSIHKGNKSEAIKTKLNSEKEFKKLKEIVNKHPKLEMEGSYNEASEEFGESILYFDFVYGDVLSSKEEIGISNENYLGALSDLTGELARKAVILSINKKEEAVNEIYDFVSAVYKKILSFNFRNGKLRKKSDSIKWNLSKIEDILYDMSLRRN